MTKVETSILKRTFNTNDKLTGTTSLGNKMRLSQTKRLFLPLIIIFYFQYPSWAIATVNQQPPVEKSQIKFKY